MQKKKTLLALCIMCAGLFTCGTENKNTNVKQETPSTTTMTEQTTVTTETTQQASTEAVTTESSETAQSDNTETSTSEQIENTTVTNTDKITDDQALEAIRNYCYLNNPESKDKAESNDHTIYWTVESSDADEIVVLYRSYTGAQTRYHIDPVSGETYVTELVPGIIDEEQRTEESLNINEYLSR